LAGLALSGPVWSHPVPTHGAFNGTWRNPRDTVHLELHPCGAQICGIVIWASDASKKAAARFSKVDIVGQQLFRDFTVGEDGLARGKVYVPDLGMTFKGAAQHIDADTIKVKGCVIGNMICKSQVWKRLPGASH
jgi:uncharacterized protein (DUF2147 family)